LRWTVDTPLDLELIRQIFSRFPGRVDFSWLEILDLIEREPDLLNINEQVKPKHYRQVDERGYQ
jgi:spore coat polysaccharide biosynthesis protein SpsF